jgi:hypothetical protein
MYCDAGFVEALLQYHPWVILANSKKIPESNFVSVKNKLPVSLQP